MRLFSNLSAWNLRWRERCPFNGARRHVVRTRSRLRARRRLRLRPLAGAGQMRRYQRGGKKILTDRAGWCEKSQYHTKVRPCDRMFNPFSWVRKWSFLKGWVGVFTRACVFVWALRKDLLFLTTNYLQCLRFPVPISKWRRGRTLS